MSFRPIEKRAERDALLSDTRGEYLAQRVEAVVLSVRAHLNQEQADVVRLVLRASIETDPVLRLLAESTIAVGSASPGNGRP
jgi:hypothetical protein